MFRRKNGKLSFSWGKFAINAFPVFANDSIHDSDISIAQKDELFIYQCILSDPRHLNEHSFYVASIVDHPAQSLRILRALQKACILSPHPSDATVYTDRITKHFANQLPFLSIHRQRKLVSLLFFWEEELMRWKAIQEEEWDLTRVLRSMSDADAADKEEFELALGVVRARWAMKPSLRREERWTPGQTRSLRHPPPPDVLPGYGEGVGTVLVGQGSGLEPRNFLPPFGQREGSVGLFGLEEKKG